MKGTFVDKRRVRILIRANSIHRDSEAGESTVHFRKQMLLHRSDGLGGIRKGV